jgi:hypothetical protein
MAGPVVEADHMAMRLDDAGKDGLAAEIDRALGARGHRCRLCADGDETAVADRDRVGDRVGGVHGMDAAVGQHEIG